MRGHLVPLSSVHPELVDRWARLGQRAVEANPFFDPEFVLPAARFLDVGDRIRLLWVEDAGRMVFAMPVLEPVRYRRIPVPAVSAWQHPYCFLHTPLIDPHVVPSAAWGTAITTLRNSVRSSWLVIDILSDGRASADLDGDQQWAGGEWRRIRRRERAAVLRTADADSPGLDMGSATRKSLRRRRCRLADHAGGPIRTVDRGRAGDGLDDAIESFLALEASGWKGRAGSALLSLPGHAEFFRAMCRGFAAQGRLQLLSLEAGARPFAMTCNVIAGEWAFNFKIAFAEEAAKFSPGLLLEQDQMKVFGNSARLVGMDRCAIEDDANANRLYADRRALSTLLVHLHGRHGRLAVRHADTALAGIAGVKRVRERTRRLIDRPVARLQTAVSRAGGHVR